MGLVVLSPASPTADTMIYATRGSRPGHVGFADGELVLNIVLIRLTGEPSWTGRLRANHGCRVRSLMMLFDVVIWWIWTNSSVRLAGRVPGCWTRPPVGVKNTRSIQSNTAVGSAWRVPRRRTGPLARSVYLVIDYSGNARVGSGGGFRLPFLLGDRVRRAIVGHHRSWHRNHDRLADGFTAARGIMIITVAHAWARARLDVNDGTSRGGWMRCQGK